MASEIYAVVANRTRTMSFQGLCDFYKGVTLGLTGSLIFPTPPITLADQTTNADALQAAILAWGPVGNRGSHAQYQALLVAQTQCINDLQTLAGYVQYVARLDTATQFPAILSAGMRVKNPSNALATWGIVNNYRQLIKQNMAGSGNVLLRWSKPDVLPGANSKPPAYNVYESADNLVYTLKATTSSTTYLSVGVGQGNNKYYKVAAVSAAGEGVISSELNCFGQ